MLPGKGSSTIGSLPGTTASRSRSIGSPSRGRPRRLPSRPRDGGVGAPAGEVLRVGLVTDQPWTGYNWYDGSFRSRVDLNTDVPLIATLARTSPMTYPGHHLEHVWKEADQVRAAGHLESSAPHQRPGMPHQRGPGELGYRLSPGRDEIDLLLELFGIAGPPIAADDAAAREAAATVEIERHRRPAGRRQNAALMRHVDGLSHDEVLAYLRDVALMAPDRRPAAVVHRASAVADACPSSRWALLRRWLDLVPGRIVARFGRLLHEQFPGDRSGAANPGQ